MSGGATVLVLVRHAEAPWRPDEQRPLSEAGHRAARELAERLAPLNFGAVYASTSRRAIQTVEPLAARLGRSISKRADLVERRLGAFSSGAFEEAVAKTWSDFSFAFAGGEANAVAQARGWAAVQEIVRAHPGDTVAVGTHGNLLSLILNRVDERVGFDFWAALTFPDAFRLEWSPDGRIPYERLCV